MIGQDSPDARLSGRLLADAMGDALMPENLPGHLPEALRVPKVAFPVLPELVVDEFVLQDPPQAWVGQGQSRRRSSGMESRISGCQTPRESFSMTNNPAHLARRGDQTTGNGGRFQAAWWRMAAMSWRRVKGIPSL
jgi:hypothetical protein